MRWATAIAAYAELLRHSPFADKKLLAKWKRYLKEQSTRDTDRKEFYNLCA